MMSTIRPSTTWVWVAAIAVALAAVASCFGPQTSHDYYDRGVARFKDDKNKGAFELPLHRLMFRPPRAQPPISVLGTQPRQPISS